jgi:hypothetical protein
VPVPPILPPPAIPTTDCVFQDYGGYVTELTKDSITIERKAFIARWPIPQADGSNREEPRIVPAVSPRKFAASETLAAGKIPMQPRPDPNPRNRPYHVSPTYMYRLTDVKVGDTVLIYYSHLDGVDICDHIRITKRPGGRMPALPKEAEDLLNPEIQRKVKYPNAPPVPPGFFGTYIPYNEYWDAYWDLEDKGIPFPEKFGKKRRWPVAPMPRELKPLVPLNGP